MARKLVHQLKFGHGAREGVALASMVVANVRAIYRDKALPSCLLPMPLAWQREVYRGYNQAAFLSQHIAEALDIEVQHRTWRRQHGASQQSLDQATRRRLKMNTFTRRRTVKAQHVAIVDDVLTTGRSVQVLAATLTNSAVRRVDVWCATRATLTPSGH